MSRQRGQTLILVAILGSVLVGFLGLLVDGGRVASEQRLAQGAADGAALGAAYSLAQPGATIPAATTPAQDVVVRDRLATGDLTMTYLDAAGRSTGIASSVATVQADVSRSQATFFLGALNIRAVTVSARAQASVGAGSAPAPACAMCVMTGAGTTIDQRARSTLMVSGLPLIVDSGGAPAVNLANRASMTAPSVVVVGGVASAGTIPPAATTGPATPDPLPGLAAPVVAGAPVVYQTPGSGGSFRINPGVYSSITVLGGDNLTMNPVTYVLTGVLDSRDTLLASGVTLYLACTVYPAPCPTGGSGGYLAPGAGATFTAPTTGTYANLAIFADRKNRAQFQDQGGTLSVTGTVYTPAMDMAIGNGDSWTVRGQLVI